MSTAYHVRQGYLIGETSDLLVHVHEQPTSAGVVVISGALGVSCSEPRYLMTLLARRLAADGAAVVQYDHPANGDSTGNTASLTAAELFDAGRRVLEFAERLSPGPLAVIGYGAGNAVAASLLEHAAVHTGVLLAPCIRAWSWDWASLCQPGEDDLIAPPVTPDGSPAGDVWRALYGEPVVPSQPPGPVGTRLVTELGTLNPYSALSAGSDVLVISDMDSDLGWTAAAHGLAHQATPSQPSWHWNLANRSTVVDVVADWVTHRFADPGRAAKQKTPDRPGSLQRIIETESVPDLQSTTSDGRTGVLHITVGNELILGILRLPDRATASPRVCVIYETGNPGQRVDIHCCGPTLAERLAAEGLASFRYDPRGMGTSQGNYHDMTWSRRAEDLAAVIDALDRQGLRSIVILGNSAGARVALRAAHDDPRVKGLVLWGPILSENADESTRPNLIRVSGGLATEWCGLPLGLRYQRDMRDHDYLAALAGGTTPVCLIFADDEPDQANMSAVLAAAAARDDVTVHTAPGQHGYTWQGLHEAITLSMCWIKQAVLEGNVHNDGPSLLVKAVNSNAAHGGSTVRRGRGQRVATRNRPRTWRRPPLRIAQSECISCDACIAACPPSLGAVFRVDRGLAIIPELCSGCGLCMSPACPVDCIHEDPEWTATGALWQLPLGPADPYVSPDPRLTANRIRRW